MRDNIANFPASDRRRSWVETAGDVAFAVCCFAGVVSLTLVAVVVCGVIWLAVAR